MVKRGIGERARTLFDNIDLEILKALNTSSTRNASGMYMGLPVLKLAEILKIKHNSLKPHINKLRVVDILTAWKNSDGKAMIGINYLHQLDWIEYGEPTKEEIEEGKLVERNYLALLELLKKIDEDYYGEKEIDRLIDLDLRKKKELQEIKITKTTKPKHKSKKKK